MLINFFNFYGAIHFRKQSPLEIINLKMCLLIINKINQIINLEKFI